MLEVNEMLEDTGERIIPEKMKVTSHMLIEHLARYHFANLFLKGKVLDMASGTGYGTHIIAKRTVKLDHVIGVDHDKDTLAYARHNYYHPKSSFVQADVADTHLLEKIGQFDCIVSFETLEHIREEEQFLSNIYHMLKPGGTLILSTPFGKGRHQPCGNPFHVHQFTEDEFKSLFKSYQKTTFYYQNGALIVPEKLHNHEKFPIGIVVCEK